MFADTRAIELQIGPIDAPILHSPSVASMECIGGTGDLVTGLATAFLCANTNLSDASMGESCTAAARMARLLAQHCAPPSPPSPLPFIGAYGIGGIVIYMSMTVCPLLARECVYVGLAGLGYNWKQAAVGVGLIALGWLLMKGWRTQAKAYSAAKRRWQSTWFCHACGQAHQRG